METINTERAKDLLYENLAMQDVSEHRWYTRKLVVFSQTNDNGNLRGFYYLQPATEMQEGQDIFESDPVEIFPVVAKEITTTVYARVIF
jgi:hypothetical protein